MVTRPRRYLFRMVIFVLAVAAGAALLGRPLLQYFLGNPAVNFGPGEVTHVEVTFTRTESGATELRLVHTGFAALRPDHPVRHGQPPDIFVGAMGRWWGDLLTSFREHVAAR